jgi:L,D-transpeptidase-like protein
MRRIGVVVTVGALLAAGLALAPAATASTVYRSLRAGQVLHPGDRLVSANHRYQAMITTSNGRLIVLRSDGKWMWHTPASRHGAHVNVGSRGGVVIKSGSRVYWGTHTTGSGTRDVLTMRNDGVLALTSGGAIAWSSAIGNGCGGAHGKTLRVDISRQLARMCNGGQQIRATWVTTGASARGDGTPTGRWHVQARIRNTTLHPADGGAYRVRYWVPYDGAYGVHDSPWQHFAYGSSAYRTRGSHGCVHLPGAMMAWFYSWARVGTTVSISR